MLHDNSPDIGDLVVVVSRPNCLYLFPHRLPFAWTLENTFQVRIFGLQKYVKPKW
jgi:hypothetical protein